MRAGVLSFDLSPSWCGWCFGTGDGPPTAGAFQLPDCGADLGALANELRSAVMILDQFGPAAVSYEAPILLSHDSLIDLRRIYGLGMVLELICGDLDPENPGAIDLDGDGIPCGEIDLRRVKAMMTGDTYAKKKLVAAAAEKLGVVLPAKDSEGRLDAGDGVGVWLVHMAEYDPVAAAPFIATLRGSLL